MSEESTGRCFRAIRNGSRLEQMTARRSCSVRPADIVTEFNTDMSSRTIAMQRCQRAGYPKARPSPVYNKTGQSMMVDPLQTTGPVKAGPNLLTLKLSSLFNLAPLDLQALKDFHGHERLIDKDQDFIIEGQVPWSAFLVEEGMAMRYRTMPGGGRQILSLLIPGDLCDIHASLTQAVNYSISAVTRLRITVISRDSIVCLYEQFPNIRTALWLSMLQEEAMLRERIVSLGRRDARGRISHLLCELFWRHEAIGLADGSMFQIPLTQMEIGDMLGLTQVHVNRVLRVLREQSLIAMEGRKLHIRDVLGLQNIAEVNKNYLSIMISH